jgi:hypothetical protein
VVIHSHGASSDFWDLDGFQCLFRHPSLRYLHASCFVLPVDLPELEPYAKTTPLTTLIFDECELEPKSIGRILRTPKALRHLTLGENVYNITNRTSIAPKLSKAPEASLEALQAVTHSLETLTHHDPLWRLIDDPYRYRPIKGDGLRNYHQLIYMDIEPCSFLHQIILSHRQAPPILETLRLRHARARSDDITRLPVVFDELPKFEPYTYLPSLKTLEFVQGASAETFIASPRHICSNDRMRERHAYAYKLHQHGIAMRMFLEATWKSTLMPPYLHREPKPELVSVYDSKLIGFRRNIGTTGSADHFSPTLACGDDVRKEIQPHQVLCLDPTTQSSTSSVTDKSPETDQLNDMDIHSTRNELARRLDKVWARMSARYAALEREALLELVELVDGEGDSEWLDDESAGELVDDDLADEDLYDEEEIEWMMETEQNGGGWSEDDDEPAW